MISHFQCLLMPIHASTFALSSKYILGEYLGYCSSVLIFAQRGQCKGYFRFGTQVSSTKQVLRNTTSVYANAVTTQNVSHNSKAIRPHFYCIAKTNLLPYFSKRYCQVPAKRPTEQIEATDTDTTKRCGVSPHVKWTDLDTRT